MVSEAVEEVLNLVDKATETFKEIAGDDIVTLFDGKILIIIVLLKIITNIFNQKPPTKMDNLELVVRVRSQQL